MNKPLTDLPVLDKAAFDAASEGSTVGTSWR